MIRRPPRSTRTDTLFPSRRSSDLAGLLAVGLLRAAAVGVSVAAGAGVDAVGHVPGAERRRVAFRQRIAILLALLERLLRLLGRGFAAAGEAAVRLAPATAVFARVVEAAQFAALVRGRSEEHTSDLQSLMRISYAA